MPRQHTCLTGRPYLKSFVLCCIMAFNFSGSPALMAAEEATEPSQTEASSDLFAPVRQSASNIQNLFSGIKQYLGTRYRFGGDTPSGFDCSGFVRFMFSKELDVQLPRSSQEMSAVGTRVERNELKPGDLVFFKNGKNHINHVGIFIGNDTFVHSSLSKGITRDTLNESYYNKRFATAVRVLDDQQDELSRDIELLLETLPDEDSRS